MTSYLRYRITVSLVAIALGQPAYADNLTVPPVPPAIQVEAGNTPFLKGQAVGTQNYICLPSPTGFSWTLFGPQATLFYSFKIFHSEIRQQITTHFLSANPDEKGMNRPTWQSSFDTSAVWGAAIASSIDPNFVAPGAIPWLLVRVVGAERGPTGGDFLTQTTFIHRLNTSGGMAPSSGCSQSTNVGATALVPYTADYFFYKASR
jgi:Protein of unknown function (DUF3455)